MADPLARTDWAAVPQVETGRAAPAAWHPTRSTQSMPSTVSLVAPTRDADERIRQAVALVERYGGDALQLGLAQSLLDVALEDAWARGEHEAVIQLAGGLARLVGRDPSPARAERHLRLGMMACREVGDTHSLAVLTNRLGILFFMHGQHRLGWRLWRPGLALDTTGRLALWEPVACFATLVDLLCRYSALDRFLGTARQAYASGDPVGRDALAVALFARAFARRRAGIDGARQDLMECLALVESGEPLRPDHRLFSLIIQCELARVVGDDALVRACVEAAIGLATLYADHYTVVALLLDQGQFVDRQGSDGEVRSVYDRLRALTYESLPLWRNGIGYLGARLRVLGDQTAAVDARGGVLTAREREVLRLISSGASNRQAAALLTVSATTVKKHLEHIYAKLGASNRTAAVAAAREIGLLG